MYNSLDSCQRDVPKSPYRSGSDDARGGHSKFMIVDHRVGHRHADPPSSISANGSETTLAALSGTGWALDYPTRPIHLIVGFPPGGAADLLSRLVGQALSERLGQQIV